MNALIDGIRQSLDQWFADNDITYDLELAGGAIMVAADVILTRIFGDDAEETIQ